MKQNPKNLLTSMLLLVAMCCGQRAMAQTLVLWHADGTTTDVELFTQPQIKFEKEKVLITSSVLNMEYPKNNVLRFTYKNDSTTAVGSGTFVPGYTQKNNQLIFHRVKSVDNVAVYSTNGIRVPVRLTTSGNDVILSLFNIPSGVYLLNVNGKTSKFTKP